MMSQKEGPPKRKVNMNSTLPNLLCSEITGNIYDDLQTVWEGGQEGKLFFNLKMCLAIFMMKCSD